MKKFKKLLAAVCTGAMMLSSLTVFGAQDASALPDGTAYLNINNADWGDFDAEWTNAEITGDGSYTVGMVASEGQSLAQFNALEVVNGESYLGTGCVLTVDSIKINGEDVELAGSSYTCSADGTGVTTRVNIYNEWNAPDDTATAGDDGHLDQRVAEGNLMDATACLFSSDYVDSSSASGFKVESMEVTFTVSNFGVSAGGTDAGEAAGSADVDLDGKYNAYIGFQSPSYSFRNAFDDATYGRDTEYFNQITGWDASNNAVTIPGTLTDTVIDGNGTYTISANGIEFAADDFASQDHMNLIFISTDIPNTGAITISDIKLNINGRDVSTNPIVSPDSVDYLNMLIQNIWNDDVATIGYYEVPVTDINITFTVSGFNYDNPDATGDAEAAPADDASASETAPADTQTDDTDEVSAIDTGADASASGVNPVVVVVIVVVVVAVAAGVVVVLKKKKETK